MRRFAAIGATHRRVDGLTAVSDPGAGKVRGILIGANVLGPRHCAGDLKWLGARVIDGKTSAVGIGTALCGRGTEVANLVCHGIGQMEGTAFTLNVWNLNGKGIKRI